MLYSPYTRIARMSDVKRCRGPIAAKNGTLYCLDPTRVPIIVARTVEKRVAAVHALAESLGVERTRVKIYVSDRGAAEAYKRLFPIVKLVSDPWHTVDKPKLVVIDCPSVRCSVESILSLILYEAPAPFIIASDKPSSRISIGPTLELHPFVIPVPDSQID